MHAYTILTPTGDRPEALRFLESYIQRLTIQPTEWIVVDDGKTPLPESNWYTLIRREPRQIDPLHTIRLNILLGLDYVSTNRVIIMEDDDWYAPDYCEALLEGLETYDLVGRGQTIQYNLRVRKWRQMSRCDKSCLCQSAFTSKVFDIVRGCCIEQKNIFLDSDLWERVENRKVLDSPQRMIGLKGLPGRFGWSEGHRPNETWMDDPCLINLRQMLGSDIEGYCKIGGDTVIPEIINGIRVIKRKDGSFTLPRCSTALEKELDQKYIRLDSSYRWYAPLNFGVSFSDVKASVAEATECYIIGKGPSLDLITHEDLKTDIPVFCINDSIHAIESIGINNPLFCVQQDAYLRDTCLPSYGTLLVSNSASRFYEGRICHVYNPEEYGLDARSLTAEVAITMASRLGIRKITFLGFDACVSGNVEYAESIEADPADYGLPASRFLGHCNKLRQLCDDLGIDYCFI